MDHGGGYKNTKRQRSVSSPKSDRRTLLTLARSSLRPSLLIGPDCSWMGVLITCEYMEGLCQANPVVVAPS